MRAQHQRFFHNPEEDIWGDCHRTALAMLLDMDRDEIPNFGYRATGATDFNERVDRWLESQGFTSITVGYQNADLEDVLDSIEMLNGPGLVFLLGGASPRGDFNHTVVAGNGQILLDPHPDNTGLVGPCRETGLYWVTFVVKKDFVRREGLNAVQLALCLPATN